MYITRLQAINISIDAIKKLPQTAENEQAIERLTKMKANDNYVHWTKEQVFNQLDKWRDKHNRNPTVTDLIEPDMPKAITIKKLFDMRASVFLNIYYPIQTPKKIITKYSYKTKQEWVDDFKVQYEKIKPCSAKDYDVRREASSPTWLTIARYLGVTTWQELIQLTNVNPKYLKVQCMYKSNSPQKLVIETRSLLEERIQRVLKGEE